MKRFILTSLTRYGPFPYRNRFAENPVKRSIGGTSLSGGRGSVVGTLLGACIIGVLANGLILLGLSDFMRQMITGFVIILAVILDKYRERLTKA